VIKDESMFTPPSADLLNSFLEWALQPTLETVLASGASTVRVVMPSEAGSQEQPPLCFALGPARDMYAHLDKPLLALSRQHNHLELENLQLVRTLVIPAELPLPGSLKAAALYHEGHYYGVLWAAFDQPRLFSDAELDSLSNVAGNAALAVANAGLYRNAEVGRQRLSAILASTPDPVLVTDQDNNLILANPAAKSALGALAASPEGQPTEQVISQQELRDLLMQVEGGKRSAEVLLPDGKVYYATASNVLADGHPVGRVCVLRDVTHFKELDALKSDFVSTASHDLRSPLTLMRGYATLLDTVGELNETQKKYVSKILDGVDGMTRLVNNLLDLGRIEAGVGLLLENVAAREIVDGAVETYQLHAGQKGIKLSAEMGADLPGFIEADRALLTQALYNLVENAIKYTPENGAVTLRVRTHPDGLQFEVTDTGIGIAPDDLPRLFEKFFRGHQREARAQRGSGLGLAIVRSIAEQHGGRAWVESIQGQGSTFFLLIPVSQNGGLEQKSVQ
jgi:PAS domain S-box-containing protein